MVIDDGGVCVQANGAGMDVASCHGVGDGDFNRSFGGDGVGAVGASGGGDAGLQSRGAAPDGGRAEGGGTLGGGRLR